MFNLSPSVCLQQRALIEAGPALMVTAMKGYGQMITAATIDTQHNDPSWIVSGRKGKAYSIIYTVFYEKPFCCL